MPPFLDFTSALPWIGSGFVLGLIISWLFRKISGVDARRLKEIEALSATVDDARRAHASLTAANAQLEGERSRLLSEINQISPRAALLPQYERQAAELKQALTSAQNAADAANKDLVAAREQTAAELANALQDAEVKGSTAKYYEEEYGRLHAAHQALTKDWSTASGLVSKLQADYAVASREAQESTRLRSEVASLRAQIESLKSDVETARTAGKFDAAKIEAEATARVNHIQSLLATRDGEIARLNGEAQKYQSAQVTVQQLEQEVAQLKSHLASAPKEDFSAEVSRLNELLDTTQKDLRNSESIRMSLTQETKRLTELLDNASKKDQSGDVQRLSAEVERFRADVGRINGEVARLTEALEEARNLERSTAMELHSARTDLSQARTALEETTRLLGERHGEVEQLREKLAQVPDIESYRRFKDALDAANRIAAGLPEKS